MVIRARWLLYATTLTATALASADPAPPDKRAPVPNAKAVAAPIPTLGTVAVPDPPPPPRPPRSLRDEAARVTSDLVAGGQTNHDPDLLLMPWQLGRWSANGRAAKLSAGAAAATFVGEAALGLGGSPIAALAAFAAGATLDAAAADVEAASPAPRPARKKPIKHKLR